MARIVSAWRSAGCFLLVWVLLSGAEVKLSAAERKPNLIVFLTDDTGYGEYGFQGNKEIPTPHIDSIAASGVRFTAGYVSGPYCSPTRAGLMTGRYQTRFGHEFNGGGGDGGKDFGLPLTETTIADRLKALGYATCCVGKWHLGGPPQFLPPKRGFDEFFGTVANTPFFLPPNFVDSRVSPDVKPITDEAFYTTDAYAERAVDWMGRVRKQSKEQPFFLYFPFNAQHAPLQAPQKYLDRFPNVADEKRRLFSAMMSAKDDAVGRVLEKVRALGEEENTLIFFLSDNGGPTPSTTSKNGPLHGFKATTSEGGVRVPFCAQWKGVYPAGMVYEKPIIQLDILPTAVTAAGGTVDPAWKLDGVDLTPYLTGKNQAEPHQTLYWRFGEQWAIRKGDWKLVVSRVDGPEPRLFNLKTDIGEANDRLAAEPEIHKELLADWKAWNAEQKEPLWKPAAGGKKGKAKAKAKAKTN